MTRVALVVLVLGAFISGAEADYGAVCRQKAESLHVPDLICPGDHEWSEAQQRPQGRQCRPWNVDFLRKLYVLGDTEQRAWAQKAVDDIWAGRNGWCPVK